MASSKVLTITVGSNSITATEGNWSIPADKFTANTLQTVTFTIKDSATKETEKTIYVYKDTKAPELTLTAPIANSSWNTAPEAKGSISDAGIGVATVEYQVESDGNVVTSWTSVGDVSGSTSWSKTLTGLAEGTVTLKVRARDKLGHVTTVNEDTTRQFYSDLNDPTITETDNITSSVSTYFGPGYSIELKGSISDTNSVDYVIITDGTNTYSSKAIPATETTPAIPVTISLSGDTVKTKQWSITFTPDSLSLAEGIHNFRITGYDTAGKSSETLTKTLFVDTKKPTISNVTLPGTDDTQNPSFRFTSTTDDNGNGADDSGVANVYVMLLNNDDTAPLANDTRWVSATGTINWSYQALFSGTSGDFATTFSTRGWKKLYVKAVDNAGNISDIYTSAPFLYDTADPTVTLDSYVLNSDSITRTNVTNTFISDNFKLNATVTDDYRIAKIEVQQGDVVVETITIPDNTNLTTKEISVLNLPRDVSNTSSPMSLDGTGSYTFKITVTDGAGNEKTSSIFTTTVDKTPPTIQINNPANNLGKSGALSAASYTFRGEASDNTGGSDIAEYHYVFSDSATAPETGWNVQSIESSWELQRTLFEGDDFTTENTIDNSLHEGLWYLHVYATDKAGNNSYIPNDAEHPMVTRSFWVDKASPVLSSAISENADETDTVVKASNVYYFDQKLSGTASATDSSNVAPDITFWIGTTEIKATWGTGANANKWTIDFDDTNNAGKLAANTAKVLTIRATDVVNKYVEDTYSIYRDTAVPTLKIEAPLPGANYQIQDITVRGTTGDAGSGVKTIEYSTNGTSYTTLTDFTEGGQSWSMNRQLTDEGNITIYVKATDRLGHESLTTADLDNDGKYDGQVTFYYDANLPNINESDTIGGPGDADSFTLTGKVWDTNGISYIEVYDQTTKKTYQSVHEEEGVNVGNSFITVNKTAAKTADNETQPTNDNWTATFVVNNSTDPSYFTEESHSLTIKAYDVAGRASEPIYKSIFVDRVSPVVSIDTPDSATNQTSYLFTGTINEANISTVSASLYRYVQGSDDELIRTETVAPIQKRDNENKPISGMYEWSYSGYGLDGGENYYIIVTVKDRGDRIGTANTQSNLLYIDTVAPTTTLTGSGLYTTNDSGIVSASTLTNAGTYYANSTYTLSGEVTEDRSMKKVELSIGNSKEELTLTNNVWSKIGLSASASYTITLTDTAGNSNRYTIDVIYDTDAPTVTIKVPVDDITDGQNALDADTYSFRIGSVDAGVGVAGIKYKFTGSGTIPTTGWIEESAGSADKFIAMKLISGTTGYSATQLCEGNWSLHVIGIDKAGNESTEKVRTFIVDKANPEISEVKANGDAINTNDPYYFNESTITFSGKVSDTNGLATTDTIVIKKGSGNTAKTLATINAPANTTSPWTWTSSAISTDDTETNTNIKNNTMTLITIVAKDKVGKESTILKYNVYKDTVAPAINITSIANGDYYADNYLDNVGGTIIDAGSGVKTATYKLERLTSITPITNANGVIISYDYETGDVVVEEKTANTGSGFNLSGSKAEITKLQFGNTEGALLLTVTAEDEAGNSETKKVHFSYDLKKPDFTETAVGASGKTTNTTVTFSGTAKDTNEFTRIEFEGYPSKTITYPNATVTQNKNTEITWTQTFDLGTDEGKLADGTHIFTITGYDAAGKSTQIQRTVIVDTNKPKIDTYNITGVTSATIEGKVWYGSANIPVEVTASDTGTDPTGIQSVEYSLSNATIQNPTWNTLALSGGKYKGIVNCENGENTITVRTTDIAGNVCQTTSSKTIYIDTNAPDTAELVDTSINVILTNNVTINGSDPVENASYIVYLTASDTSGGTGISATEDTNGVGVKFVKIGNTTLANAIDGVYHSDSYTINAGQSNEKTVTGYYTVTIPATAVTADGSATFEVVDKVGNKGTFSLFQLQRDKTYPKVSINVINDADTDIDGVQINKTTTISGTASDNQGVASVLLQYAVANTAPVDNSADWLTYTTITNNPTVWSVDVDTTQWVEGAKVFFRAIATDKAGNKGNSGKADTVYGGIYGSENPAKYAEVIVSQDSDRPVIRFNNIPLNGMSSSNAIMHRTKSVLAIVSDDDGDVNSVYYSIDGNTWSSNVYKNGLINFEMKEGYSEDANANYIPDGATNIFFKVIDAKGTPFISSTDSATEPYGPKLIGSDSAKLGYKQSGSEPKDDIIYLKLDTVAPTIVSNKRFYRAAATLGSGANGAFIASDISSHNNWTELSAIVTEDIFGGTGSIMYIMYTATDANSIASSGISVDGKKIIVKTNADGTAATAVGITDNLYTVMYTNYYSSTDPDTGKTAYYHDVILKLDITQIGTGIQNLYISATDLAGQTDGIGKDINFDNTSPVINISSHSNGANVYGSSAVKISGSLNESNENPKLFFGITQTASDSAPEFTRVDEYMSKASVLTWQIAFDGNTENNLPDGTAYHAQKLNNFVGTLYGKTTEIAAGTYEDLSPVCIWLYSIDAKGNTSEYTKLALNVIPQGDKPNVSITYPEPSTDPSKPNILGGTIRITGTSDIQDNRVSDIYLQIDPSYNGTFNTDWDTEKITTDNKTLSNYFTIATTYIDEDGAEQTLPSSIGKGIKKTGSNVSWSLVLNEKGELNSKIVSQDDPTIIAENAANYNTAVKRKVAIRAYAISASGKVSNYSETVFEVDPDAPLIGNTIPMELVQFEACAEGDNNLYDNTIIAKQNYVQNMWVKGKWYLHCSVEDDSGISKVVFKEENNTTTTEYLVEDDVINAEYSTNADADSGKVIRINQGTTGWGSNYGYELFMPINTTENECGTIKYYITIYDNSGDKKSAGPIEYVVKYDNKAPVIAATTSSAGSITAVNNKIYQSNGTYSIKGNFSEIGNQSGFKRIAMYYTKTVNGTTYIIDPLQAQGDDGEKNWYSITGASPDLIEKDGMYWITATNGSINGTELTIDLNAKQYKFARTGSLVMIDSVPYLIKSVTPKLAADSLDYAGTKAITIGLENNLGNKTVTSLYFGAAQIIDNLVSQEGGRETDITATYDYTINSSAQADERFLNDDGDQMIEKITENGASYIWSAYIDSRNIYDGSVTIHFTGYDAASNYTSVSYEANVSNNGPRFANLSYGTDENGNGIIEDNNEVRTYYRGYVHGDTTEEGGTKKTSIIIEDSKRIKVKGKMKIIPEIVGGNKGLGYSYKSYTNNEAADNNYVAPTAIAKLTDGHAMEVRDTSSTTIEIGIREFLDKEIADGPQSLRFDIFDRTVYDTSNSDYVNGYAITGENKTNSAYFVIPVNVMIRDTIRPTAWLRPFYWNSLRDNSIYGSSSLTSSSAKITDLKGHIELEKDWKETTAYTNNTANDKLYDDDPKVSGKITIKGAANDNVLVNQIDVAIKNLTTSSGFVTVAKRNASGNWEAVHKAAAPSNADTMTTEQLNDYYLNNDGYLWEIDGVESTTQETGNTVKFKLHINTEKIPNVAEKDITVEVKAYDRGSAVKDGADGYTYSNPNESWTNSVTKTGAGVTGVTAPEEEGVIEYIPDNTNNHAGDKVRVAVKVGETMSVIDCTCYYKMDVVPYITKVYTNLAKNKKTNWSVYNRTALGHYPVQSVVTNAGTGINLKTKTSESVTLYGFNLNAGTAKIVSGDKTFEVGSATDSLKIDNSTAGQLKFNVENLSSGELNLTVNGCSILNNKNNNDGKGSAGETGDTYEYCYNRQANGDTNNLLTDDVEFDVWEFNDRAAVPINGLSTGINMEVNQTTGMLNYAFANGGLYFSMGGYVTNFKPNNDNNANLTTVNDNYSSYYWAGDWDTFAGPCVGFHVDELGYTYSVVSGGDTNSSGSVDKWDLYTSRWGAGIHSTAGTLNDNRAPNNRDTYYRPYFRALRLEEIALKTGTDTFAYSLMKYRFLSPEFASTVNADNTTNLYLVYYDALCNQIRFRAGTFNNTVGNKGGFTDSYTGGASSYYNTNNCEVIANGKEGGTWKSGANTNANVPGIQGRGAGQYVDVAVVKNASNQDVVCVVWYDAEDNCCKFSYTTNPIANWNSHKGKADATRWSGPQTIFDEGGEYCHIVADKNNHLHIAAYAGNGDVKYAYLDTYTSTATTCTVDASGAVGEHLTLDVAVNSNNHSIPYIGYYTSAIKMPKYAYLVDKSTGFSQSAAGVDDDERFTGNWEVTVVPSPSRMTTNREDKVNIGVWKNAGVLTDSKIGAANNRTVGTSTRGGALDGYNSTNWSKTYGNGTSNAVLGYQISTSTGSCLETAQKR